MTEKRILTGYSKDVQADFERLKKDSTYPLLVITGGLETLDSLKKLIVIANINGDKQILQDIADFINNKAKFPEQKYYLQLIKGNENSYLNINLDGMLGLGRCFEIGSWKTKFTCDEVVAIDPRLVPFMEEVEDD